LNAAVKWAWIKIRLPGHLIKKLSYMQGVSKDVETEIFSKILTYIKWVTCK
jgi:hypothetical protein